MINTKLLRSARVRNGVTAEDAGTIIGKSDFTYRKKEQGGIPFTDDEKIALYHSLGMSIEEFVAIFFSAMLPTG